jgi:hypothetical protein
MGGCTQQKAFPGGLLQRRLGLLLSLGYTVTEETTGYFIKLTTYNFCGIDSLGCVARIYHKLRLAYDCGVVVVGVVGHDQHAVILRQIGQWRRGHIQVVMTTAANRGKVGIVIDHLSNSITVNDGDSRRSSMSFLYAIPNIRIFDPFIAFLFWFSALAT